MKDYLIIYFMVSFNLIIKRVFQNFKTCPKIYFQMNFIRYF